MPCKNSWNGAALDIAPGLGEHVDPVKDGHTFGETSCCPRATVSLQVGEDALAELGPVKAWNEPRLTNRK